MQCNDRLAVLAVLALFLLSPSEVPAEEIQEVATLQGHEKAVECVEFSPSGSMLATGGRDKTVRLWEPATGKQVASLSHRGEVYCLAFAPNGKSLAAGDSEGILKVWPVGIGKLPRGRKAGEPLLARSVWGGAYHLNALGFSPNGRLLAMAGNGGDIQLLDTASGLPDRLGNDTPDSLAFSPNGRILATAAADGVVTLWDLATREKRAAVKPLDDATNMLANRVDLTSVVFAPTGKAMFVATARDATVTAWDVVNLGKDAVWAWKGSDPVHCIAISPDNSLLAVGAHYPFRNVQSAETQRADANILTLRLLDAVTGKELASRIGQRSSIVGLAFSPDGKLLASGSRHSGEVKLWNTEPYLKPAARQGRRRR